VNAVAERLPKRLDARDIAIAGIVVGAFAFWVTLPPISARGVVWPILAGLLAVGAGIWAINRDVRRAGWGAVAAGLLGIGMGVLATNASASNL
jgi:hypothetical protein